MKKVIIIVESQEQLVFFRTFVLGLLGLQYHPLFLTNKFSVMLVGKCQFGLDITLVRKGEKKYEPRNIERSVELLLGHISQKEGRVLFDAFCWNIELQIQKGMECIWIWGGNTIASMAAKMVAEKNKISFLLFDKGNIEGKMFVDTRGTTTQSWLYEHPEFLIQKSKHPDTNSVGSSAKHFQFHQKNKLNYFFFFDFLFWVISGIPFVGEKNPIKKLFKRLTRWEDFELYDVTKKHFIYIALPHSFECKKRYAGIERYFSILDRILTENRHTSRDVVVTIHPLEDDKEFVERLRAYALRGEIQLTSVRATELLQNCKMVYSFNTSVALHAIMNNVQVEFVEDSLFKGWTSAMAKNYIDKYLIDLSIDDGGYCSTETIEAIFERMSMV